MLKGPKKQALEEKIGNILSRGPMHLPSGSIQVPFYQSDQSYKIEIGDPSFACGTCGEQGRAREINEAWYWTRCSSCFHIDILGQ